MKLLTVIMAAFVGSAAARGWCCIPGCFGCDTEDCGANGYDCSRNKIYVTCCIEGHHARAFLAHGALNGDGQSSKTE
ncbi:unnamed protein product [Discula destructiva]